MVCIFEGTLWFPFSPLYFQTKTKMFVRQGAVYVYKR